MDGHGILLYSDIAARTEDGGRPRRESRRVVHPGHGIDRRRRIAFEPRPSARTGGQPKNCPEGGGGGPSTTERLTGPRAPGDDAHRDVRGAGSTFGDRYQERRSLAPRIESEPTGARDDPG